MQSHGMAATNRKVFFFFFFCLSPNFFNFILLSYSLDMDLLLLVGLLFLLNAQIQHQQQQSTSQPASIRKRSNSTTLYRLDGDDFVLVWYTFGLWPSAEINGKDFGAGKNNPRKKGYRQSSPVTAQRSIIFHKMCRVVDASSYKKSLSIEMLCKRAKCGLLL
jgi:hypothetical protein